MGSSYNIILVFILAHMVGDFVLQTDKIVKLKAVSIKGIRYHISFIAVAQMLFLSVFGFRGLIVGFLSAVTHFGIDILKLKMNIYIKKIQSIYFILDQAMHFSVLLLLSYLIKPTMTVVFIDNNYIKYLIAFIFYTYVQSIFIKMVIRDIYLEERENAFFKKGERIFNSIVSLGLFLMCVWTNALGIVVLGALGGGIYLFLINKIFRNNYKVSMLEYLLLFTGAAVGGNFFF